MSKQPEVLQSELLNQFVLDRTSMQELGQIEVLWMYPKVHRVLGFICKSGLLGRKKTAFNLDQLQTIGTNGILVNSQPVDTDAEKVRQLESLVNWEVWTDAGNKAGKITDYLFDLRTGVISHYLFVSSGWSGITGSTYRLPPNYILSLGNQRVLVSEAAVHAFAIYREGIQEKLSKAADFFRDEKTQVTQEWRSLIQQAKSATGAAKERAQLLAEQAKERAQIFNEHFKERAETLAEQAKEKGQVIVDQVKEKTYEVVEQVQPLWDELEVTVERPIAPEPDPLEDWDDEIVESIVDVQAKPIRNPVKSIPPSSDHLDEWGEEVSESTSDSEADFVRSKKDAPPTVVKLPEASQDLTHPDLEDDDPWI